MWSAGFGRQVVAQDVGVSVATQITFSQPWGDQMKELYGPLVYVQARNGSAWQSGSRTRSALAHVACLSPSIPRFGDRNKDACPEVQVLALSSYTS